MFKYKIIFKYKYILIILFFLIYIYHNNSLIINEKFKNQPDYISHNSFTTNNHEINTNNIKIKNNIKNFYTSSNLDNYKDNDSDIHNLKDKSMNLSINYNKNKQHKFEMFCINLDKDKVRWDFMKKQFDTLNINVKRFPGIKISNEKELIPYNAYIEDKKIKELKYIHKNGYRIKHSDLTYGAIGCYLSHANLWLKLHKSENDFFLIFEDDSRLPINFNKKFKIVLETLPKDWDIILLGYVRVFPSEPYNKIYDRVKGYWGMHAYLIHRRIIDKIGKDLFPINFQIDSFLRFKQDKINIFGVKNNEFINQAGFKTNIQINLKEYYDIKNEYDK